MNESRPPWDAPAGADPLLRPANPARGSSTTPSSPRASTSRSKPTTRRRHAARGARAVALATSVAATGVIAGAMAYLERPDDADGESGATAASPVTTPATAPTTNGDSAETTLGTTANGSAAPTTAAGDASAGEDATDAAVADDVTSTAATTTSTAATGAAFADGTWVGTPEYTEWGDVQVQVTVSDGQIVDIASLQMPNDRKSSGINDGAEPVLEAQALAIQGAELDIVSGATYTSRTYATSLQAALDEAALAAQEASG